MKTLYERIELTKQDWPLAANIWTTTEGEPFIIVAYVYLRLLEIPEAKRELIEYRQAFIDKYLPIVKPWFEDEMGKATKRARRQGFYNPLRTADDMQSTFPIGEVDKVIGTLDIFKPWVKKWAADSTALAVMLFIDSVFSLIACVTGKSPRELRRHQPESLKFMIDAYSEHDERMGWAWRVLLTGPYTRAQKTTRKYARQSLRSHSYFRKDEMTMAKWVDYWVKTHILGWTTPKLQWEIEQEGSEVPDPANISLAFKGIDHAMNTKRTKGAPLGKPRFLLHERRFTNAF